MNANETHDWHIFADFAQHLIGIAKPLYARDPIGLDRIAPQLPISSNWISLL